MTAHPRLSLNQATVKHASLAEAIDACRGAGIAAIGTWREPVQEVGLERAARLVADSGLRVSSHCRGGFLTASDAGARRASLDDNRRAIEETATLARAGAPGSAAVLVLVAGGLPDGSSDLVGARARVEDALAELAPDAAAAGVTLALEPLHPMYCADRAVLSTLAQALDMAAPFEPAVVGVVVDAFHVWWDPALETQIARAGAERRIASFQVCDWRTPLPADVLLARRQPGDGVIDLAAMARAVTAAGYDGDVEVEIFHAETWAADFDDVASETARAFEGAVGGQLPVGAPTAARAS